MSQIAVKPLVMKDVLVKFGANNYEKHVSSVKFTPSSNQIEWRGGTPDSVFTDSTSPTWTCGIDFAQDWETEDSLSQFLFDNAGSTEPFEFIPLKGLGKKKFTVNAAVQPGPIGGDIGAFATSSVTLGCDKPVISTVAAP